MRRRATRGGEGVAGNHSRVSETQKITRAKYFRAGVWALFLAFCVYATSWWRHVGGDGSFKDKNSVKSAEKFTPEKQDRVLGSRATAPPTWAFVDEVPRPTVSRGSSGLEEIHDSSSSLQGAVNGHLDGDRGGDHDGDSTLPSASANIFSLRSSLTNLNCPGAFDESLNDAMLQLRPSSVNSAEVRAALGLPEGHSYFIAILFHDNEGIIPTALGELIKFIFMVQQAPGDFGNVFVSIFESGSTDWTVLLLRAFEGDLLGLGVPHRIRFGNEVKQHGQNRIHFLAQLRNVALEPMVTGSREWDHLVYVNDVIFCASSLALLVATRVVERADLACGMDFKIDDSGKIMYYDTWVGVDMSGTHFMNEAPYVRLSRDRMALSEGRPFQVFSCWGGAVAVSGAAVQQSGLRFRSGGPLECPASECEIFCRDLWSVGRGRILSVPAAQTFYSIGHFEAARVANFIITSTLRTVDAPPGITTASVDFDSDPPTLVMCCGLDSPFENEVDFDMGCSWHPWQWWYSAFQTPVAAEAHDVYPTCVTRDQAARLSLGTLRRHIAGKAACDALGEMQIPRLLAFMWKSSDLARLPLAYLMHVLLWMHSHPCYDVVLFTDEAVDVLVRKHFPHYARDYASLLELGQRIDIARYVYMYVHGGIYIDADSTPMQSMENLLLPQDEFVIGLEGDVRSTLMWNRPMKEKPRSVSAHYFGTVAWSPVLLAVIDEAFSNLRSMQALVYPQVRSRTTGSVRYLTTILSTGTGVLSEVVLADKFSSTVRVLGMSVLSGNPSRLRDFIGDMYVKHARSGSWLPPRWSEKNAVDRLETWGYLESGDALLGPAEKGAFDGFYPVWAGGERRDGAEPGLPTYLWLRGRDRMPRGSSVGCLEFRQGQGPSATAMEADSSEPFLRYDGGLLLWRTCWPAEHEMDVVYMLLTGRGALVVYTASRNCCGGARHTPARELLWTSDIDRGADHGDFDNFAGSYRLALSEETVQPVVLRAIADGKETFTYAPKTTAVCPRGSVLAEHPLLDTLPSPEGLKHICLNMPRCSSATYHPRRRSGGDNPAGEANMVVYCSVNPPRVPAPAPPNRATGRGWRWGWISLSSPAAVHAEADDDNDIHIFRDSGSTHFEQIGDVRGTCPEDMHIISLPGTTLKSAERHCANLPDCRSVEYATSVASEYKRSAWLCRSVSMPAYSTYGWTLSIKQHRGGARPEAYDVGREERVRCAEEYHDPEACSHVLSLTERTLMRMRCSCSLTADYERALFMPMHPSTTMTT